MKFLQKFILFFQGKDEDGKCKECGENLKDYNLGFRQICTKCKKIY